MKIEGTAIAQPAQPSASAPEAEPPRPSRPIPQVPVAPRTPAAPPAPPLAIRPPRPVLAADSGGGLRTLVPDHVREARVELTFDVRRQRIDGRATVDFTTAQAGSPVLDLAPPPSRVVLDRKSLPPAEYRRYLLAREGNAQPATPARLLEAEYNDRPATRHRVLERHVEAGAHRLQVDYQLDHATLSELDRASSFNVTRGGVKFVTRMWDYGAGPEPAHFMEAYAPANLEFDQHPSTYVLRFRGATREHAVFTNGELRRLDGRDEAYEVSFPAHFNASSMYLHVTDARDVVRRELVHRSVDGRDIPIVVYADRTNYPTPEHVEHDLRVAEEQIVRAMAVMEAEVGPYPHPRFVARVQPRDRAMEHAGAADGNALLMAHELVHSWWGRGVLPADGRAGWLDETLTYWSMRAVQRRDGDDVPRNPERPGGAAEETLGASETSFERHTAMPLIGAGLGLLHQLDVLLAPGAPEGAGMRPILRELFAAYKHRPLSAERFAHFVLERVAPERRAAAEGVLKRFALESTRGAACGTCCPC